MYWENLSAFLAMGGYGTFVWGSYGVTALVIAVELFVLLRRQRTLRRGAGRK